MDIDDIPEEDGPDRDTWCTDRELARALGRFALDPFSNERSNIISDRVFRLDRGQDAFVLARFVPRDWTVFVNPPYSRGNVLRAVNAFLHTRFTFLLRYDPRTVWFKKLAASTAVFAFPSHCDFEPPPGVSAYSNIYPHALFYRREEDVPQAIVDSCLCLTRIKGAIPCLK